jgi:adhesin/invasin
VYVQVGSARTVPRFAVSATAQAGAAAKATVIGNAKHEGVVGSTLRPAVEIRVLDRAGNEVPGAAVTLNPASGTVADSVVTTDSTGRAMVAWTLGRSAGVQHLTVKVDGVERPIEIVARARAAAAANLTFVAPKPGMEKRAVLSLDVDLTDAYGNPVADQPVVFSTKSGAVSPARVMSDTHGRAHTRWTPASKVGKRTLVAAVKGSEARTTFVLEAPEVTPVAKAPAGTPGTKASAAGKKESGKRAAH